MHRLGNRIALGRHLAIALALAALALWPAFLNGYPILFSDSGNYFAALSGLDSIQRSVSYALLLKPFRPLGATLGVWPTVVLQSCATALAALSLATALAGRIPLRPLVLGATVLLGLTSLPWFCSLVLSDLFTGLAALSAFALLWLWPSLSRAGRAAWLALFCFAASAHLSNPPVLACAALAWVALASAGAFGERGARANRDHWQRAACVIALAFLSVPVFRAWTVGSWGYSRSGGVFLAGRLAGDGILPDYLKETCALRPQETPLCDYPPETARSTSIEFLWWPIHPYLRETGWDPAAAELTRVSFQAIRWQPARFARLSLRHAARTLAQLGQDDGLLTYFWWLRKHVLQGRYPGVLRRYHQSLQGSEGLRPIYEWFLPLERLVNLAAALAGAYACARRRERAAPGLRAFFAFACLYVAANAALMGTVSGAYQRYAARTNWILPLAALLCYAPKEESHA